jgi:hypothetical protein
LSTLEKIDVAETILGVRTGGDEDQWHFSGDMSEIWGYTMSEHWPQRVYSEYYTDFWADMLEDLSDIEHPVEVELDLQFEFGMTTEEKVQEFLAEHDSGPRFLVMHRGEENTAQMSCVWMRGWEIKELEAV